MKVSEYLDLYEVENEKLKAELVKLEGERLRRA